MSEFTPVPNDVTSDDRLFATLAYIFSPLTPIIFLLMEDKKNRPFIKAHNVQALLMGIVVAVLTSVTFGIGSILWLVMLWWAYKAYQGKYVNIPLITDFCKKQGWA